MTKTKKFVLPGAIIVIATAAMFVLLSMKTDPPRRPPETPVKYVQTSVVELGLVEARIIAYGRTASVQPVRLTADVSGTLERGDIPFRDAERFRRGDVIIRIDDRQVRLDINTRISELMTALATVLPEIKSTFPEQYPIWQEYFDTIQFDATLPPLPETDDARLKMFLSRYNVFSLYFTIRDFEIQLEKHKIRAPFDGAIISTDVRIGSNAQIGTRLGEIIDLERMEVPLQVQVSDLPWIDSEQSVSLASTELDGSWSASISRVSSDIDERTQTVDVYVTLDGGGASRLLSGLFLEAETGGHTIDNAYTVPPKAVYEERYVYLIENGELVRRRVTIARREIERLIVSDGLDNGDTLVIEPMQGIAPGMRAQPKSTLLPSGDV